jgi:hypothetical protein
MTQATPSLARPLRSGCATPAPPRRPTRGVAPFRRRAAIAADPDSDRHGRLARGAFVRFVALAMRWSDNDAYGHLNNIVYYSLFDWAVNAISIEAGC